MPLRRSSCRPTLAVIVILLTSLCVTVADAESWTNLRGTRTIEAELVGVWGDQALLRLPDGTRVSVKLDDLRSDSRIKARKLLSQINERRSSRTNDLKRAAEASAAPAPNPIPAPPDAPPYSPPEATASLEDFLESVHESQANGHWRVVYDALPSSSRELVNAATKDIVESLGKDRVASMATTLHRLGVALVDKQSWLRRSPRVRGEEGSGPNEFVDEFVLPLGGFLKEGFRPDVLDLDALAKGDWPTLLDALDPATAPYAYKLTEFLEFEAPMFLVEEDGNEGTLTAGANNGAATGVPSRRKPNAQEWSKVDGVWAPKDHEETFANSVEEAKTMFGDGGTAAILLSGAVLAVEAAAEPMASAESEEEYHVAIENHLLFPLTTMSEMIAKYSGAKRSTSPYGNGGNGGYEDDMMSSEEESYRAEMEAQMQMEAARQGAGR